MTPYGQLYSLHDPETNEIRYIGQTVKTLARRLTIHLYAKSDDYRGHWVRALVRRGLKPTILHIAWADSADDLNSLEELAIATLKVLGAKLVNTHRGGRAPKRERGFKLTEAHKAKVAAANTGKVRTPEQRAATAAARTGTKASPEARANMSRAARLRAASAAARRPMRPNDPAAIDQARAGAEKKARAPARERAPALRKGHSAHNKGKSPSLETREKMSMAAKRRVRKVMTAEEREMKRRGVDAKTAFVGLRVSRALLEQIDAHAEELRAIADTRVTRSTTVISLLLSALAAKKAP